MKKALIVALNRKSNTKPQSVIEFYDTIKGDLNNKDESDSNLNELILKHQNMVYKIANKYKYTGISIDDMFCEGILGLIIAFEKYDPNNNTVFSTYAFFWIKCKILQLIKKIKDQHCTPINNEYLSFHTDEEDEIIMQDRLKIIHSAIACLSITETFVIKKRFIEHPYLTFKQISITLQCSEEKARQLEKRGLSKIRNYITHHLNDSLSGFIRLKCIIYFFIIHNIINI